MNAYELADKLEQGHWESGTREQAATMLRQQQAEIEALKAEYEADYAKAFENGYAIGLSHGKDLEKNNGGNPEELNTRQIQDARTSLESTPPFAYAVYVGEDDRQNIFLQFDHPEMCGQEYKKVIPLYTHPAKTWQGLTAEEIATISNDEFRLQKVEKILKDRNTHPAKTLTDEEILKEAESYGMDKEFIQDAPLFHAIKFAKAILKKAQEK